MDGQRFDRLTRRFAEQTSRRRVIRGLLGGVVASSFSLVAGGSSVAARSCSAAGQICREDANCCSQICGPKDRFGRRTCLCSSPIEVCNGQCVDPKAFQSDINNCGVCGNRCPGAPCQIPTCIEGMCGLVADPNALGTVCDDNLRCTTGSTCQQDGTCGGGTPLDCTSQNPWLHDGSCDPNTGHCINQPVNNGTSCSDGNACSVNDTCIDGVCIPGTICPPPDVCHLAAPCTNGVCGTSPNAEDGTFCEQEGGRAGHCCSGVCRQCCDDSHCTAPATCGGGGTPNQCGTDDRSCANDGALCDQTGEDASCCSGTCCDADGRLVCCTIEPTCVEDGLSCEVQGPDESCCSGACCISQDGLVCCTLTVCLENGVLCPAIDADIQCCSGQCCDVDGRSVCCTPTICLANGAPCPAEDADIQCCTEQCCEVDGRSVCCSPSTCGENGQPCTVQSEESTECCSGACCDSDGRLSCCAP
jgi:hypothetical protein